MYLQMRETSLFLVLFFVQTQENRAGILARVETREDKKNT